MRLFRGFWASSHGGSAIFCRGYERREISISCLLSTLYFKRHFAGMILGQSRKLGGDLAKIHSPATALIVISRTFQKSAASNPYSGPAWVSVNSMFCFPACLWPPAPGLRP